MTDHQHAALVERRPIVAATLAEAREAARQLAGPSAAIVHAYLQHQVTQPDWLDLAKHLAMELEFTMDTYAQDLSEHSCLEDFCWYRDGSAALAEFNAALLQAGDGAP